MRLLPLLLASLLWPLAEIVRAVLPSWEPWLLVGAGVVASIEALASYRWYHTQHFAGPDLWRARGVEYGLFFVLIRLVALALHGWRAVAPDSEAIFAAIFDGESLTAWAVAVLSALLTYEILDDLEALQQPPTLPNAANLGAYVSPYDALTERFFAGGALVLVLSALARIGVTGLADFARGTLVPPPVLGLVGNVLVYFAVGLVVLSQAQRTLLLTAWQMEQVKVSPTLTTRWNGWAAVFLGLAALLAFVLPTGYSAGVLDWAVWVLRVVFSGFWQVVVLVFSVLFLPIIWLWSLLPKTAAPVTPLPPLHTPAPPPVLPPNPPIAGDITQGYFAWVIIAGIVVYVVFAYGRDRAAWRGRWQRINLWPSLRRWWAVWQHRWSGLVHRTQQAGPWQWLRDRLRRPAPAAPVSFFHLGAASPREQVLFYYRSLLRRAAEHGYARRPPETPHEYQPTLHQHLPAVQAEVDALTAAFLEARYGPTPPPPNTPAPSGPNCGKPCASRLTKDPKGLGRNLGAREV